MGSVRATVALALYGLYKVTQSERKPDGSEAPYRFQPIARAKFDAWLQWHEATQGRPDLAAAAYVFVTLLLHHATPPPRSTEISVIAEPDLLPLLSSTKNILRHAKPLDDQSTVFRRLASTSPVSLAFPWQRKVQPAPSPSSSSSPPPPPSHVPLSPGKRLGLQATAAHRRLAGGAARLAPATPSTSSAGPTASLSSAASSSVPLSSSLALHEEWVVFVESLVVVQRPVDAERYGRRLLGLEAASDTDSPKAAKTVTLHLTDASHRARVTAAVGRSLASRHAFRELEALWTAVYPGQASQVPPAVVLASLDDLLTIDDAFTLALQHLDTADISLAAALADAVVHGGTAAQQRALLNAFDTLVWPTDNELHRKRLRARVAAAVGEAEARSSKATSTSASTAASSSTSSSASSRAAAADRAVALAGAAARRTRLVLGLSAVLAIVGAGWWLRRRRRR